jgi:uncharacterized protein (TIGR02147 family)
MVQQSYREILRVLIDKSIKRNPQLSLRAISKRCGVSQSLLSLVLAGKKNLSRDSAFLIAQGMGLSQEKCFDFVKRVERESLRTGPLKNAIERKTANSEASFFSVDIENYTAMADWYHQAILELTRLTKQSFHPRAIANTLGIRALTAQTALERLMRLGLLKKSSGRYEKTHKNLRSPIGAASHALRMHHRQMMKQASKALDTQPLEFREFKSMTFAVDKKDIGQLKSLIRDFLDQVNLNADNKTEKNSVFQLNVHLFEHTNTYNGGSNDYSNQ